MGSVGQMLAGNFAVVALFVLLWSRMSYWIKRVPRPGRDLLFALGMSLGTVAAMYMAVEVRPGVFFDFRHTLLATAAFFGGWPAALITAAIATLYRSVMGGVGVQAGVVGIVVASGLGVAMRAAAGKRSIRTPQVLLMACITAFGAAVAQYAWLPELYGVMGNTLLPNAIFNAIITGIAATVYRSTWQLSAERELMAAALQQAPDCAYVKDTSGRFVAANDGAARLLGCSTAAELIGKTCFHVMPEKEARAERAKEKAVLRSGKPTIDQQVEMVDAAGELRHFRATKVPSMGRTAP